VRKDRAGPKRGRRGSDDAAALAAGRFGLHSPPVEDVETQSLSRAVAETRALLRKHGDTYVAARLAELEARLAAGDRDAVVSALTEATGGMGSLRDRILCPENGDRIRAGEVEAVNLRLAALVRRVETEARAAAAALGIRPFR
jgi:hypothetical protein